MSLNEHINFSEENLFYINKYNHIELYDKINGFIGEFYVWYDDKNDEYLIINDKTIYLDNIPQK